ncbi:MAG: NUDIX domain-containing protein [Butyrivibrio sp.]|nr:NUDIX domain-containing protein [Butyrivibrio sp.]
MQIRFYDEKEDSLLKFAVIIAKADGKYVFCMHRERSTYEIPGGHRENGESILDAAKRELYEETGAVKYDIKPVCIYSVTAPDEFGGAETFGGLFFAEIEELEEELYSEIERIAFFDAVPSELTYPLIQPKLIEEAERRGFC